MTVIRGFDITKPMGPFGIIFGDSGVGKTTAVAECFPDYVWFITSPDALRRSVRGGVVPKRVNLLQSLTPEGNQSDLHNELLQIAGWWLKNTDAPGIVIDELSTALSWAEQSAIGDNMSFAKIKKHKKVSQLFAQAAKQACAETGRGMICVAHAVPPRYHEQPEGDGPKMPNAGQLKYKGGPLFPLGTEQGPFMQEASFCIQLSVDRIGDRQWLTTPNDLWARKFRDAETHDNFKGSLRELLTAAGYLGTV